MKFGSKHIFNIIMIITSLSALYLAAMFTAKCIMYQRYSHVTVGQTTHWGVLSLDDDHHQICVDYTFEVGHELFCAQYLYPKPVHSTKEIAESNIELLQKDEVTIWYSRSGDKAPISLLEKTFPKNELYRLLIVVGILIYFKWLNIYLYRFAVDEEPAPESK